MKSLVSLVSWRKQLSAENKEMPTGVVSGCRQICLPVVGVHNKARLLTHLHMSLACLQLPTNSLHFCVFFFFLGAGGGGGGVLRKYNTSVHTLLTTIYTGCVGAAHLEGPHIYHGGFTLKGWGLGRDG